MYTEKVLSSPQEYGKGWLGREGKGMEWMTSLIRGRGVDEIPASCSLTLRPL